MQALQQGNDDFFSDIYTDLHSIQPKRLIQLENYTASQEESLS